MCRSLLRGVALVVVVGALLHSAVVSAQPFPPEVFERQALIQQVTADAARYAEQTYGELYCGLWLDAPNNAGHILLKDTSPAITAPIAASVSRPDLLVFDYNRYNERELLALRDRIWAERDVLRAQGVEVFGVGLGKGKVGVSIISTDPATTDAATATLFALYGGDAVEVSASPSYPTFA